MNRHQDWLGQAKTNFIHAKKSASMGDYGWACFAAHQAGEAAVKSLHIRLGQITWGNSVAQLLVELPEPVRPPAALLDRAKVLDRHYIPTRYPDAHPAGSAHENYTESDANQALESAEEVLTYCERESLED